MTIKVVSEEYGYRRQICFPYHPNDIKWNSDIFFYYPIYGFFSGVMAALLGVGGGLILVPLLLELGIHPLVIIILTRFQLRLLISLYYSLQAVQVFNLSLWG